MNMDILQKNQMENNYFSLEVNRSNKLIRIFQFVFGILCIVIAVIWLILNHDSLKSNSTLWLSIIFLIGFAWYQINSGLGRGEKYLKIGKTSLKLKKNSLLPSRELIALDIERIEIFPISMIILLKTGKKVTLRFGTTFTDIIDPVKRGIEVFCSENNIHLEFRNEQL